MIVIRSPLPLQDCIERLTWRLPSTCGALREKSIVTRMRDGKFYASCSQRGVRNSFKPRLTARLEANGAGTDLLCSFGLSTWVTAFIILWSSFVTAIGVAISQSGDWKGASVFFLMFLLLGATAVGGYALAASDKPDMITFLKKVTEADGGQLNLDG